MTLGDFDRQALQGAIQNLERLVVALKARTGPPHPDDERQDCLDRLTILNPELTSLRLQLNDLSAADVTVAPPTVADREVMTAALVALGAHVAADQRWEAFCTTADKLFASAQTIRSRVGARRA